MCRHVRLTIASLLLLLLAATAGAEGPRPVLILTAEFTEAGVKVAADTNLPAGSRVDLLLQHRGRTLASARLLSAEGHFEANMSLPHRLPPSYYDVVAVWVPQYQVAGGAASPSDRPLSATVSVANGTREAILKFRNQERAFHTGLLVELGKQFQYLHEELSVAVREVRDPEDPSLRSRLAASQAMFVSHRNEILEQEKKNGTALLGETQFLSLELIDYLLAVHEELLPAPGRDPAVQRTVLIFDGEFLTAVERGYRTRATAVQQALAREHALGDIDLLIHTLRTMERLRGILLLARTQDSLKASETSWRTLARPLEEDLQKMEDASRILVESAQPGRFAALAQLTGDLRRLWDELVSVIVGRNPSWKGFDDIEKSVREEFPRVVEPLGLDYVRMEW